MIINILHQTESIAEIHHNSVLYVILIVNSRSQLSVIEKSSLSSLRIWFESKPYIDVNTSRRAQATNAFEKNFYKLMNNTIYGKTMENVRNRKNIKFFTNPKTILDHSSRVTTKETTMFTGNLAAIASNKYDVKFDKPIYVGA